MAQQIDEIYIMNMALIFCKIDQKITQQTQGPFARAIGFMYDEALANCMSEAEWNFAKTIYTLNKLDETPENGKWTHKFQLPSDIRKVGGLVETGSGSPVYEYEIAEGYLYANQDNIQLIYVKNSVTPAEMPAPFRTWVALVLAMMVAPIYATDTGDLQYLIELHNQWRIKAHDYDSEEEPLGGLDTESSILNARFQDWGNGLRNI